jgi:hypothetical protein
MHLTNLECNIELVAVAEEIDFCGAIGAGVTFSIKEKVSGMNLWEKMENALKVKLAQMGFSSENFQIRPGTLSDANGFWSAEVNLNFLSPGFHPYPVTDKKTVSKYEIIFTS